MHEIFPIVAGLVTGLIAQRLGTSWLRIVVLLASSLVFGTIASFISGELFMSWAFLAFDVAQVLLTAGAAVALTAWWQRRPMQLR
jgi:hypothetical protein